MAAPLSLPNRRRQLLTASELRADELIAAHDCPPSGTIAGCKLVVTFEGAFEFEVGRQRTWVDSSTVLFASDGEDYVDHHVIDGIGHASVVLSPDESLSDEIWRRDRPARSRRGSIEVQLLAQRLRRSRDPLEAHELALSILAACTGERRELRNADHRCVRQAKEALQECTDGRMSLDDLAGAVGMSASHLRQCFRKVEGIPIYQYQTQLRISRALARLPDSDDITDLALSLGFSSHSHFTAAFRARVGMTPSEFRTSVRR